MVIYGSHWLLLHLMLIFHTSSLLWFDQVFGKAFERPVGTGRAGCGEDFCACETRSGGDGHGCRSRRGDEEGAKSCGYDWLETEGCRVDEQPFVVFRRQERLRIPRAMTDCRTNMETVTTSARPLFFMLSLEARLIILAFFISWEGCCIHISLFSAQSRLMSKCKPLARYIPKSNSRFYGALNAAFRGGSTGRPFVQGHVERPTERQHAGDQAPGEHPGRECEHGNGRARAARARRLPGAARPRLQQPDGPAGRFCQAGVPGDSAAV